MKDFLQDLVSHTHTLGVLPLIRITATEDSTKIDSIAEDRSIILNAQTHQPISDLSGIFGMTNLNKLDLHLKCPEYKENADISLVKESRNNEVIPTGIHFQNKNGDFQNDYRFMVQSMVDEKMKPVLFNGAKWVIEFEPSVLSIQKFKFQASANSEETVFQVSTEGDDLIFSFGALNTHAGKFVFQHNVTGTLKHKWSWPVSQILSVLNLTGNKTVKISDVGALQITVDSGITEYNYIFPAYSK